VHEPDGSKPKPPPTDAADETYPTAGNQISGSTV
jgi:hypothetical protein